MTRKIIQLVAAGDDTLALADDGTTWIALLETQGGAMFWKPWAAPVPQDKPVSPPVDALDPDEQDMLRLCRAFGPKTTRCKGDRLVAHGYICPHCRSCNPSGECNDPRAS
jgi:hypothetical protein